MSAKLGRPKGGDKFTLKIQKAILAAIADGAPVELAAAAAGIRRETLWRWKKKGLAEKEGPFHDFVEALELAEGKATVALLRLLKNAGPNWQRFAWILERRWPEHFFHKFHVEMRGAVAHEHRVSVEHTTTLKLAMKDLTLEEIELLRKLSTPRLEGRPTNGQSPHDGGAALKKP